jgi:germination protein M
MLALMGGCAQEKTEEETGYLIYYDTPEGTRLQTSSYQPTAQTFEEIMDELAGQLATPPIGMESVLKDGVTIQGYQRGIDALRIDFSKEYYDLDHVDEVLLRAAVVKTFSQVPGVTKIMITVDNEQLVDDEGELVEAMDRDDFINTQEGDINSYQYASLMLYFVDSETGKLVREVRSLHYSSNMVLENVVTEQLLKGPEDADLSPVFVSSVKLLSVHVQDGICTIDLDSAANQYPTESRMSARTALYALVNSICDTCDGVEGVRIRIDGESDAVFRDEIPLNQVFYMETSEVETAAELDSKATEMEEVQTQAETEADTEQMSEEETGADSGEAQASDSQQVSGVTQDGAGQAADASDKAEEDYDADSASDMDDSGALQVSGTGEGPDGTGAGSGEAIVGVDPALTGE